MRKFDTGRLVTLQMVANRALKKAPGPWTVEEDYTVDTSAPRFITCGSARVVEGPYSVQGYESCTIVTDESDEDLMAHVAAFCPETAVWLVESIEALLREANGVA